MNRRVKTGRYTMLSIPGDVSICFFTVDRDGQAEFHRIPERHAKPFAADPKIEFACRLGIVEVALTERIHVVEEIYKGDEWHAGYQMAKDFAQENL
jgi:hypothetical protein